MTPNTLQSLFKIVAGCALIFLAVSPAQAQAGNFTRISVDSNEVQANAMSYRGDVSTDGRFVAFDSEATNLMLSDLNNTSDVFLRDLTQGTTSPVSVNVNGTQADGGSGAPSISADGRFVAFESSASNLTSSPDANGFTDIYVKDMQTGVVVRASLSSAGSEPNNESASPSISGDGRFVVFDSDADNLVPNDTNGRGDIFLRDLQLSTTVGVSTFGNSGGYDASISLDGRFVVFSSSSTNLIPNDTNGKADVFVYSVATGQIVRASVSSSGAEGLQSSLEPSISGDGRYVTFTSASINFASINTYDFAHLYIRDMQAGVTTLVTAQDGFVLVGISDASEISANGRYIVYSFDDKGDGMPDRVLYVHDRVAKTNTLAVGRTSDYTGNAIFPSISGDGRLVVFSSSAGSFVSDDTNNERDVFLRTMNYPPDLNPSVVSIVHSCPNGCSTAADQVVDFLVKFSEPVSGVDMSDFVLTSSGGIAGAVITSVGGVGSEYVVRVDTGSGDGTIRLDVIDNDSIMDIPLNPLGGAGAGNGNFTAGEVYVVDKNIVAVTSITRLDNNPTAAGLLRYAVNFSEPVSGVDAADFIFTSTGSLMGMWVSEVSGAGTSYTVTVNAGTGDGTLRLDLQDNDSIVDAYSVPLGGLGGGTITPGDVYTLDRTAPTVLSILKMDADPTTAEAVHYSVIFSEYVSGVDIGDFMLTANGVNGATVTELFVNANTYMLTVSTGTGNGSLRLDVLDNDSILDAVGNPLNATVNGPAYTVNKAAYILQTERLRSTGTNDGWVLESKETSNTGGTKNAKSLTLNVGDDAKDRQYRAVLHFPTHHLPDDAVITQVILMLKLQGVVGENPFATHGNIFVDMRYGPYGNFGPFGINSLQISDFQAQAHYPNAGVIQNNPVDGWYWALLDPNSFAFINKTGVTQLRLAFPLDDNDDLGPDYLTFFSGDTPEQTDRPHLQIQYHLP